MTYQSITLVGNVTRDPEMRYLPNGDPVTSFGLAVNEGYGDSKYVMWVNVSCFGKLAETMNNHLTKGGKVLVSGTLAPDKGTGNPRTWMGKDEQPHASYEVRANTVRFLDSKKQEEKASVEDEVPF